MQELAAGQETPARTLFLVPGLIVLRSRQLVYAKEPALFLNDIGRLVGIKRRLLPEEMVID